MTVINTSCAPHHATTKKHKIDKTKDNTMKPKKTEIQDDTKQKMRENTHEQHKN